VRIKDGGRAGEAFYFLTKFLLSKAYFNAAFSDGPSSRGVIETTT
jgi:hypothetical protein